MARFNVNQLSEYPYHITGRRINREAFPIDLQSVWRIFEEDLYMAHHKHGLKILSFVLMPNHFHLMARTTKTSIGTIMSELLTSTSKEINRLSGRVNQNFGGRHYKCELSSYHYYMNCHKYVYQNPMRAQLSKKAELWPYSSLNGILGLRKIFIPLEEDTILFSPKFNETELQWINNPIKKEDLQDFRSALKKKTFLLPRKSTWLPRHRLEIERI
jgi:putative transposase